MERIVLPIKSKFFDRRLCLTPKTTGGIGAPSLGPSLEAVAGGTTKFVSGAVELIYGRSWASGTVAGRGIRFPLHQVGEDLHPSTMWKDPIAYEKPLYQKGRPLSVRWMPTKYTLYLEIRPETEVSESFRMIL